MGIHRNFVSEAEVRARTTAEHTNSSGGKTLNVTSYTYTYVTINTKGISSSNGRYYVINEYYYHDIEVIAIGKVVQNNIASFIHTEAQEYRDRSMWVEVYNTCRCIFHTNSQISIKKKHRRMA
jgi:hypothetical protein